MPLTVAHRCRIRPILTLNTEFSRRTWFVLNASISSFNTYLISYSWCINLKHFAHSIAVQYEGFRYWCLNPKYMIHKRVVKSVRMCGPVKAGDKIADHRGCGTMLCTRSSSIPLMYPDDRGRRTMLCTRASSISRWRRALSCKLYLDGDAGPQFHAVATARLLSFAAS